VRSLVSWIAFGPAVAALFASSAAAAALEDHPVVSGGEIADVEVRGGAVGMAWTAARWDDLSTMRLKPGRYEVRVRANGGGVIDALELAVCAGKRGRAWLDGEALAPVEGARVVPLAVGSHAVVFEVNVSAYEHRIACGERPRAGRSMATRGDLGLLTFDSPRPGGGRAAVYIPPGHDASSPSAVLVGTHPWNGDIWTYAAYAELLAEAKAKDVVLLMPSGLGNSLYTADAETEVMAAIAALEKALAVDPQRVSIWGASMGGAGATTIGFHHPDAFASITSYFGDSQYDVTSYVKSILPDEAAAHAVNALDIVDNARNVPVWLIHGEVDRTSNIAQSVLLADAMRAKHFDVRFDRVPGMGHEGALVVKFIRGVVDEASEATVRVPSRVTYWSVRPDDVGAYGVGLVRASPKGDAFIDVERRDDGIHVHRADGVTRITLRRGSLGVPATETPPIVVDRTARVIASWDKG
jgi:pimeloyl-ACP methyl ester carboxylesterase